MDMDADQPRSGGPSNTLRLQRSLAAIACLVNKSWYTETVRYLYQTVIISRPSHYVSLFTGHGPMHVGNPGEHTKLLKLVTPPRSSLPLCVHRTVVPYIQFDFGSSSVFFDRVDSFSGRTLRHLGRTTERISALATCSVPLYQLAMCLEASKMRLFVSEEHPVDGNDDIWQDLIAGHVAALRMMANLQHLVLDAELYLILLPAYFKTWCQTDMWIQVLAALKSESTAKPMATFFDETSVSTLTLIGAHVPTLAFLARISRAPKVTEINLAGWNKPDIPEAWSSFLKEERASPDPLCNWVETDPNSL
ncbi:hypothetical protein FRB99_005699 [Tulasnella sp. 403]|nr:hypothetical protein FRB99_005699 [Tulasnella sp. 403]